MSVGALVAPLWSGGWANLRNLPVWLQAIWVVAWLLTVSLSSWAVPAILYFRWCDHRSFHGIEGLRRWIRGQLGELERLLGLQPGPKAAIARTLHRLSQCAASGGQLGFALVRSETGMRGDSEGMKPFLKLARWRVRSALVALHHESEHHRLVEEFRRPQRNGGTTLDPVWLRPRVYPLCRGFWGEPRDRDAEAFRRAYGVDLALLDCLQITPGRLECRMEMTVRWRSDPRPHILSLPYLAELAVQPLVLRVIKPLAIATGQSVCRVLRAITLG